MSGSRFRVGVRAVTVCAPALVFTLRIARFMYIGPRDIPEPAQPVPGYYAIAPRG